MSTIKSAKDECLWECTSILSRYKFNPILEAKKEHFWESKMVYNAAAFKINGTTYIIYRAFGHDHISRLGLAWSTDGINIVGRLPFPVFEPVYDYEYPSEEDKESRAREKGGCEDPRITVINDNIYMVYTAYSKLCQTSIASIAITDFKALIKKSAFEYYENYDAVREEWNKKWFRYGPVFPRNIDKQIFSRNACVFPVEVNGKFQKYALIYRLQTSKVMIAYSDTPSGPWSNYSVFMEPTEYWEGERMGICSPPVYTEKGLFFVYHGVDEFEKEGVRRNYRLGGLFLNFTEEDGILVKDIKKIKVPILSPERGYEEQSDWLEPRNVFAVFSCAALPFSDKKVVEIDDDIIIYYGAGDVRICAAKTKLRCLLEALSN